MTASAPRRQASPRQLLVGGTMTALALGLLAAWVFVVRPAADDHDRSVISPDQLVGGEGRGRTTTTAAERAEVGKPAPDLRLTTFDGTPFQLAASLRGKPSVINFWASNCTPCVTEMPMLQQTYRELGDSTNFVGIDVLESPEAGQGMIVRTGVLYRQAVDPTGDALAAFGATQLPLTVVLRPDGTVASMTGRALHDATELRQLIEAAK